MSKYRHEIVFRTVYLEEDGSEKGVETEAILFQDDTEQFVSVKDNMSVINKINGFGKQFELTVDIPWNEKVCDELEDGKMV